MAGRVNTKFVIVLSAVLVVLVLGVAAALVLKARRDPGRYIARAEKLMVEGDYENAAEQYGRAYVYEKNNDRKVAILLHRADALKKCEVMSTREAQELMTNIEACWQKAIDLAPANVEASEALLELHHERAEAFSQYVKVWDNLYAAADNLLKYDRDNLMALRYRGIAQMHRAEQLNMGESALESAMADLQVVVEKDPGDVDVNYNIAVGMMLEADAAERLGREQQAADLRAQAMKRIDDLIADQPDNADAILAKYRLRFREGLRTQDEDVLKSVVDLLTDAEQILLKSDAPEQTRLVATQLEQFDGEMMELADGTQTRRGLYRAEQLLRHAAKLHPDDPMTLVSLGMNLQKQGRFDDALAFFLEAKKDRPVPLTIMGLRAADARAMAMKEAADLYLAKREMTRDPDEREAFLEQARAQVAELETVAGDKAALTGVMRGKLALVTGNQAAAISELEKVNAQFEGRNAEVLTLLATAYQQAGETGAAAAALERLLATPDGARRIRPYLQLAQLRMAAGDFDTADALADRVLTFLPDNTEALVLKAQIAALRVLNDDPADRAGAAAAGLAVLEPVKDQGNREVARQRARLIQQRGDDAEARAVLEAYLADHPDDLAALQDVVRLDAALDERDKALARVESAMQRAPDNQALQLLATWLKGDQDMGEQVETLIEKQQDPLQRQLAYYQFYQQTGETEKADQALAAAKAIDPDDPRILSLEFNRMLQDRQFEHAAALVERVKKMNDGAGVDYAGGAFWEARLQLARGDYSEAAETLNRGLKLMPNDSDAQMLLGRTLIMVGDMNGAERALRKAIDVKPDQIGAWVLLHRIHDQRQQFDEALDDLERAVRFTGRRPGNAVFEQYLSYMGQHGDRAKAIAIREELAAQRPDDFANRRALAQLYLNSNQSDKAKAVLDALLQAEPDALANIATMAIYYASQNDYERGRQMILDHIKTLQADGKVTAADWITYARYLIAGRQLDDALAAYRRAIDSEDPKTRPATREMANALFALQRFDEAADQYARMLSVRSEEDPTAELAIWRRYVETLMNAGRDKQAEQQLAKLLEKHPSDSQSLVIKGLMLSRRLKTETLSDAQRQRLREQADLAFDQAVAFSRNTAMPYIQRAVFRMERADQPQIASLVESDLRRAIELDPTAVRPRELMVDFNLRRGDTEAAIGELQRLIVTRPNYAPARARLAEFYLSDPARAVDLERLLTESQELFPNLPVWHQFRARLYQAQSKFPQAERELARAYELDKSAGRLGEYVGLLVRLGRNEQVLDLLADQPEAASQEPALLAVKSRALYSLDRTDEAVAALNLALDRAGDDLQTVNAVVIMLSPVMPMDDLLAVLQPRLATSQGGAVGLVIGQLRLGRGQNADAIAVLTSLADKLAPDSADEVMRQRMLAQAYYGTGDLAASRKAYETVLRAQPSDLMALNNLAYLLADDLKEPASALPLAQRAVEAAGASRVQRANVLDTLGWVQYRNGDTRAAEESLKMSIGLNPMAATRIHLAQVYAGTERASLARQELIEARKLAERDNDARTLKQIDDMLGGLATTAADAGR